MPPKGWKQKLLYVMLFTSSGVNRFCISQDAAWSATSGRLSHENEPVLTINSSVDKRETYQASHNHQLVSINAKLQQLQLLNLADKKQRLLIVKPPKLPIIAQANPAPPTTPSNLQPNSVPEIKSGENEQPNESPQLDTQPRDVTQPSLPIEQLLDSPQIEDAEKLERLRRRLQEPKQPATESNELRELGLRVRQKPLPQKPLEQVPPPEIEKPVVQFKPIGFLQARIGFFYSSNIFSSNLEPVEDGLIFSGLRLASAYFPLSPSTYVNGSVDGNLIHYVDQSKYNYNQLRLNVSVYQQLSPRMYGEIGWSNQQVFYANNSDRFQSGDRFLGENSLRLSLGRRDPLSKNLTLDSFYEFSASFSEPNSRSRIVNSFWVSLNYYLQKPLQVGLDYQFNVSDFTERPRDDHYHRLFGHLIYRVSDSSSMNFQSGVTFGDSTDNNIDFDGWFFSINYNFELGRF